ncbi:MAG TPA: LysR substrate-binding domain-containing protein [Ferrovibrio sp.]|uniref:LysR family transcriptional regulator n=1 Tax=Ferrovibrio sp. TaxID=1917215 RepID=UPI002ED4F08D
MELSDLSYFAAVARCGSISRAAQQLNTVQSNVTTRIKLLEERLGTALFNRHSRGMRLTAAGQRLLPYAGQMIALAAEARQAVKQDGAVGGALAIGTMETTAAVRLPALLARFHAGCPDVQLDIGTGTTAALLDRVLERSIDGAFVAAPVEHPDLIAVPLVEEELVLVMAQSWPDLAAYRAAHPAPTAVVFRAGCSYRQRLEQYFSSLGWMPFRRLEFGTLEGILGCVSANVGITLLPRAAVEKSTLRPAVRIQPIPPEQGRVQTLFVRRRDGHDSAALRAFIGCFGDAVA